VLEGFVMSSFSWWLQALKLLDPLFGYLQFVIVGYHDMATSTIPRFDPSRLICQ